MADPFYPDSLLGRLDRHVQVFPEQTLYTFLHDQGTPETLTFGQTAARVRMIAARLRERGRPGERAVLLYPQGLEFICAFLGCLAAGVVAVPAFPPRKNRKAHRLNGIIADCEPAALLTTTAVWETFPADLGRIPAFVTDQWKTVDAPQWDPSIVRPDTLAFLQYTSGSTGDPKGVMVSHANIAANEKQIQTAFGTVSLGQPNASVAVGWLPMFHDMGLIGHVLQPLYTGFPSVLFSPTWFTQEPVRWLRAISDYRGTSTGGPNFAFDLCARTIKEEQKVGLDLSCLRVLYNASEPLRADTLDRFGAAFANCGFQSRMVLPCYGLAEATLLVSSGLADDEPKRLSVDATALENGRIEAVPADSRLNARCLVSCGEPAPGTEVVIWDTAANCPALPGRIGEVWVKGESVAAGYWSKVEQTQRAFNNRLDNGSGPFLATGDLGFLDDGELYITGRMKDLMIIRGRNIYPQDVEAVVAGVLPFVEANSCAAFTMDETGQEQIAIVIEADRSLVRTARNVVPTQGSAGIPGELTEAVAKVRQGIADELEVSVQAIVLVRPGSFPRTSSGKVQRHACRNGLRDGTLDVVYAWRDADPQHAQASEAIADEAAARFVALLPGNGGHAPLAKRREALREYLLEVVNALLGLRAGQRVSVRKPLQELGFDSLLAVELSKRVQLALALPHALPATMLFNHPSIADLEDYLVREVFRWEDAPRQSSHRNSGRHTALENLENLSDTEVDRLFEERLAGGSGHG